MCENFTHTHTHTHTHKRDKKETKTSVFPKGAAFPGDDMAPPLEQTGLVQSEPSQPLAQSHVSGATCENGVSDTR